MKENKLKHIFLDEEKETTRDDIDFNRVVINKEDLVTVRVRRHVSTQELINLTTEKVKSIIAQELMYHFLDENAVDYRVESLPYDNSVIIDGEITFIKKNRNE